MADDLVAELTLRLRNETTAGLDALRAEFSDLRDTLSGINGPLSTTEALMAQLKAPAMLAGDFQAAAAGAGELNDLLTNMGLNSTSIMSSITGIGDAFGAETAKIQATIAEMDAFQDKMRTSPAMAMLEPSDIYKNMLAAEDNAKRLVGTIEAVGPASSAAAQSVAQIGTAIDADTAKMKALLTDMGQAQDDMHQMPAAVAAGGGGGGAAGGGGNSPNHDDGQSPKKSKKDSDEGGGFFAFGGKGMLGKAFEAAMVVMGADSAADAWAKYDTLARQITVTQHLPPAQSNAEVRFLKSWADHLGTRYANSSMGILEADQYLITDHITQRDAQALMPRMVEASTAYNVPITDIDQAAGTLVKNIALPPQQVGDGLAILHHAAMMGHFTMDDFSRDLPGIGGQMSIFGMHGLKGEITAAAALELIRRNAGDDSSAYAGLSNLMMYLHSPMALRMFDRTTKMDSLLGAAGRELLDKYHVKPLNLPEYLNDEEAKGVDPVNAMADYFAEITKNIKSPTDKGFVIGAFMHNHEAQQAMVALVQYHQAFDDYQRQLSGVSDATLAGDWYTATAGRSADTAARHEAASEWWRGFGGVADWGGEVATSLMNAGYFGGYGPDGTWSGRAPGTAGNSRWRVLSGFDDLPLTDDDTAKLSKTETDSNQEPFNARFPSAAEMSGYTPRQQAAPLQITPQIPITVNVHVDKNGNVSVDGGVTGGTMNAPAGTNVRVNQGNVLNGVH